MRSPFVLRSVLGSIRSLAATALLGAALLLPAGLSAQGATATMAEGPSDQLSLDARDVSERLRKVAPDKRVELADVALFDGPTRTLELERFSVFRDDAVILVQGEDGLRQVEVPDSVRFRGHVQGEPESMAVISVDEQGEVRGLIATEGRLFLLEQESTFSRAAGMFPKREIRQWSESTIGQSRGNWTCGHNHEQHANLPGMTRPAFESLIGQAERALTAHKVGGLSYAVDVAVETDFEYWDLFEDPGESTATVTDQATDYVAELFGVLATVYARDVQTELRVSYLKLYSGGSGSDPWTASNPGTALDQLMSYWNQNRSGVDRTITHFLSGKNQGGGVAYLGVMCSQSYAYGVTAGIDGNYSPSNPYLVWDFYAVAHEIGHNFGSPHTHCYNPPVDQCFNGEGGCYSGSTSLPGDGGSIMSYCHLQNYQSIQPYLGRSGHYGNNSQRVNDEITSHLAWAEGRNCLPEVGGGGIFELFADDFESGGMSAW